MNKISWLPMLFALAACHATGATGATRAPLEPRATTLQCADRKIEIQAQCFQEEGMRTLSCTSQRLTISAAAPLATRVFKPLPAEEGQDYPVVEEKIGDIVCTATPDRQQYIVTRVSNGGNCARCEWADVYGWNGALLGSSRDKAQSPAVRAAIAAAFDAKSARIGAADATPLYAGRARRGH